MVKLFLIGLVVWLLFAVMFVRSELRVRRLEHQLEELTEEECVEDTRPLGNVTVLDDHREKRPYDQESGT